VEQPKPVNHRPPRSMGNDLELAEMMAPMLRISESTNNGTRVTYMSRVFPYAMEYFLPIRSGRMMLGMNAVTPPTV
jgi:hypothetical protein